MSTQNLYDEVEEKKKLLSEAELSIWLDTYDDIFSDFDSRPFSERVLSDDFINEAKKMTREKPGGDISLKLLMPSQQRKQQTEEVIVKSLHAHFRRLFHQLKNEAKAKRRDGFLLSALGILIIICASYLFNIEGRSFLINALRIVMEPAGWFFTWTGFDHLFYSSRDRKRELDFLSRMAHAEITFLSF